MNDAFVDELRSCVSSSDVDALKIKYLGKCGIVTERLKCDICRQSKEYVELNILKKNMLSALSLKQSEIREKEENLNLMKDLIDVTLPSRDASHGLLHPISKSLCEISKILLDMGLSFVDGPEIEDSYHNFTALNTPEHHPARQMQDTFYLQNCEKLLRTQTSSVQIREMKSNKPPFHIFSSGKVYRNDWDATHTPMFHQVEGLCIDKNVSMANLKACIEDFLRKFFEVKEAPIRLRPSYFPFTEPSCEVDVRCRRGDDGIKIGEGDEWLEIAGCGMVHENVLRNVGVDPKEWQGFAFGFGIERLAMLKYNIPDLRQFYASDLRWLKHYGFHPMHV